MILRVSFFRTTTPDCELPISYSLPWNEIASLDLKIDGEQVVLVEDGTDTGVVSSYTYSSDPSNLDVLLIEVPMDLCDKKQVSIHATWEEGGDFNDDFNYDFTSDYSHLYDYGNTFEIYGYDLGNNYVDINSNPEFNIMFHVTSIGPNDDIVQVDFNDDFNEDYATSCKCYSNFIAYRQPYTDNIKFYDNVSNLVFPELLVYTKSFEYKDSQNNIFATTRNAEVCSPATFKAKLKVTLTELEVTAEHTTNCGCNSVSYKEHYVNCTSPVDTIPEIPYKYTHVLSSRESCIDCEEGCESIIDQPNTVHTHIDINPMTRIPMDDVLTNIYSKVRIRYEVMTYDGAIVSEHEIDIVIPATGSFYWNYLDTEWVYTIPDMGDYVVRVTVEYFCRESDTVVRRCSSNTKIYNCHWYDIKHTGCNEYTVYNNSFEPITLNIYELTDTKTWSLTATQTIPMIDSLVVELAKDGVYKFDVTRGLTTYTYVVINYCKLRECLLRLINDGICKAPVGKCKEEEYHKFNKLVINYHTYFSMLVYEYNLNYIYTSIQPHKLDELYQLKVFEDRFRLYCDECPGPDECGCGCK